jgi:hypothetical protein
VAAIPTEDDLLRITPEAAEQVLEELGWTQVPTSYSSLHMWRLLNAPSRPRVLVPLDRELVDYTVRLFDMLRTLSEVHPEEVDWLDRLLGTAHDVLRFELQVRDSPPGTVGVEEGLALHDGVRNALNASAKAREQHRPYFGTSLRNHAASILRDLRFGVPAAGSFVVRVIVMPPEAPQEGELFAYTQRRVELRRFAEEMLRSLQVAESGETPAVLTSLDDPDRLGPDEAGVSTEQSEGEPEAGDLVEWGVSADLLSALYRASSNAKVALTVAAEWSPDIPPNPEIPTRVAFSTDSLSRLAEVGTELKKSSTWDNAAVKGIIETLRRPEGYSGVITVVALEGTAPKGKRVRMRLVDDIYQSALEAHGREAVVTASGTLSQVGNRYWLDVVGVLDIEDAERYRPATDSGATPML